MPELDEDREKRAQHDDLAMWRPIFAKKQKGATVSAAYWIKLEFCSMKKSSDIAQRNASFNFAAPNMRWRPK